MNDLIKLRLQPLNIDFIRKAEKSKGYQCYLVGKDNAVLDVTEYLNINKMMFAGKLNLSINVIKNDVIDFIGQHDINQVIIAQLDDSEDINVLVELFDDNKNQVDFEDNSFNCSLKTNLSIVCIIDNIKYYFNNEGLVIESNYIKRVTLKS